MKPLPVDAGKVLWPVTVIRRLVLDRRFFGHLARTLIELSSSISALACWQQPKSIQNCPRCAQVETFCTASHCWTRCRVNVQRLEQSTGKVSRGSSRVVGAVHLDRP